MKQAETSPPSSPAQERGLPTTVRLANGSARSIWHKSAPKTVRRAFAAGDLDGGWAAWQAHLASRRRPAAPSALTPSKTDALDWGLPEEFAACWRAAWLHMANRRFAKKTAHGARRPDASLEGELLGWLGESAGAAAGAGCALQMVAAARSIARLAGVLSSEAWWALLDHLLLAVSDASAMCPDDDPLVHQLLTGELALTLAYQLPELAACQKLRASARRALSMGLVELLDGAGMPHAHHLALMRPLLACWTRCQALGGMMDERLLSKSAVLQFEWLVRQSLGLMRPDGSQVFSQRGVQAATGELFEAALKYDRDEDDRAIARLILPHRPAADRRRVDPAELPGAAAHSEWACTAALRPGWSRSGTRLSVAYPDGQYQLELSCGKDVLFSGEWGLDVRVDGQAAEPTSEWSHVCWESDEDADYLETQIHLPGGMVVQRQVMLAREDQILLLADAILGAEVGQIEYRGCLPLLAGITFDPADESREAYLGGRKRRALVLPLALPEWRADRRVGELERTKQGLELRQTAEAQRLYAPLLLDLDRRRIGGRRTWRQLTVAESRERQPVGVAAGFRAAVGKRQWLVYRSLAERANRTVLGHNLSTEMLVARFHSTGEVEPLLEVE